MVKLSFEGNIGRALLRIGLAGVLTVGAAATAKAADCEHLRDLKVANVTIESAQSIPAGAYQPPGSARTFPDMPAFCRVVAKAHPVRNSSIGFEIWMPQAGWNGRYQQVGNHGFAGVIQWDEMAPQLRRGFSVAATDDGHVIDPKFITDPRAGAFDIGWATNNRARVEDAAWRAVHVVAQKAKLFVAAYYPTPIRASYFNGCSDGGREGMLEAQRFPADFNGILAGSAATFTTQGATEQLVVSLNLQRAGIEGPRGAAILQLVEAAEVKACDGLDGVVDGIISEPGRCRFDPHSLICKSGKASTDCINAVQADAFAANLRPVRDPVTNKWVSGGMSPGSEFNQLRFGYNLGPSQFAVSNYRYALDDPKWDAATFDLHRDLPKLDKAMGVNNALNPDLRVFKGRGGKLIQYHGWDDAAFTPEGTVMYYEKVVRRWGHDGLVRVQDFYRLFMTPGVGHCGGGPGPNAFGQEREPATSDDPQHDVISALVAWVELGRAPDELIATKFVGDDPKRGIQMQRPLFPYPAKAVWNGSADPNDAASFHRSQ
jgi:feruloyl esterase